MNYPLSTRSGPSRSGLRWEEKSVMELLWFTAEELVLMAQWGFEGGCLHREPGEQTCLAETELIPWQHQRGLEPTLCPVPVPWALWGGWDHDTGLCPSPRHTAAMHNPPSAALTFPNPPVTLRDGARCKMGLEKEILRPKQGESLPRTKQGKIWATLTSLVLSTVVDSPKCCGINEQSWKGCGIRSSSNQQGKAHYENSKNSHWMRK